MTRASARRIFLLALVASLFATGALAIGALLVGDFDDTEAQIMLTTGAISAFSLLALPGGVLLDRNRLRPLALALFAAAAVAFTVALYLIWIEWDDTGEGGLKTFWIAAIVTCALSQAAAVLSRSRGDDTRVVAVLARASIAGVNVLAALLIFAVLKEPDSDGFFRAVGALGVADLVFVVVQPFLRRMSAPAVATAHRVSVVVERGDARDEIEREVRARGFAAAVESVIREVERGGGRVVRVERV